MGTTGKTILIVDDSLLIVERIKELLEDIKLVGLIENAGGYGQAIELLEKNQIDIIFLDIHLPGKNGIELLAFIKTNYPGITVVMLTNEASDYYRALCKKEGAAYFIDKSKEFELIPRILSEINA